MKRIIYLTLILTLLLSACISVSVDSAETEEPSRDFVTATLPPTKSGFVPATLTPTLAITSTPTVAVTAPPNCKNSAVLLRDVTIQDDTQVNAGESFTKTWEFQNNGTCPWVNYSIQFAAGDQMDAALSTPIPVTLPNKLVQISVELAAPLSNGSYTGYFTLNDADGKNIDIGIEKTFWVKIRVGASGSVPNTSASVSTQSSGGASAGGSVNCSYTLNAGYINQIANMINSERSKAGLSPLTLNSTLASAAQAHAVDMACNNMISHTSSDGTAMYTRILASGYVPSYTEEIIYGGGGPNAAFTWWKGSPLHINAILSTSSTEMGVGYAYFSNGGYGDFFVVDFGSP